MDYVCQMACVDITTTKISLTIQQIFDTRPQYNPRHCMCEMFYEILFLLCSVRKNIKETANGSSFEKCCILHKMHVSL